MTSVDGAIQLDFFDLLDWPDLPGLGDPAWDLPDPMEEGRAFWFSACHEAGHAVANVCAGRLPLGMWVQRTGIHSGMTWNDPDPLPPAQLAVSHLAGMAAECAFHNVAPWPGGRSDVARVRMLAEQEANGAGRVPDGGVGVLGWRRRSPR